METVDGSFDRLVRSIDYQLLAALSGWLTGIALPVGSATVRQVRYDPAPRTAPDHGKLDPASLCNDEEGTCMRRLALLLAVIVSTIAAVAALTWGHRRSPLPPGRTSSWT
jgi:hypothetical protein